jgi:hypothetical protein
MPILTAPLLLYGEPLIFETTYRRVPGQPRQGRIGLSLILGSHCRRDVIGLPKPFIFATPVEESACC